MPDIDIDFDERRRGEMIKYATDKYGSDRVAQIVTYGTIKAKAAIEDSARVLGLPFSVSDRITKAMPPAVMGKDIPLFGIFEPTHKRYAEAAEFRELYAEDETVRQIVDLARGLEGLKRQVGVHAAGVILSAEPLMDVLPVWMRDDGTIITQWDTGACEKLGLLKMDFLGLRNLTVLDDCLRHIEANTGTSLVLEDLALDDKPTYGSPARGDTLGVFQLDGGRDAPIAVLDDPRQLRGHFRGARAVPARPDGGQRPQRLRRPQERPQAGLADARRTRGAAGGDPGRHVPVDRLPGAGDVDCPEAGRLHPRPGRPAAPRDGQEEEGDHRRGVVPFQEGMRTNGYSDAAIGKLWEVLVPFSDYAFNKAHTAGYGLVSYWTAYLKANYPAEYMAALLSSVRDDKDKSAIYLNECRRMGIKVLPPDVNESESDFAPRGSDIRFGLTAIRNVGTNVVDSLLRTRDGRGRFGDFADFIDAVDVVVCNKDWSR